MKNSKNLFFAMGLLFVGSCFKINGITVDTIPENEKDVLIACQQNVIDLIEAVEQERLRFFALPFKEKVKKIDDLKLHFEEEMKNISGRERHLKGVFEYDDFIKIEYFGTVEQMRLTVLLYTALINCRNLKKMIHEKHVVAETSDQE